MWKQNGRKYSVTYKPMLDRCGRSSSVSNMPSPNPQTGVTPDDFIILSSSTPVQTMGDGKKPPFVHWCSTEPATEFSSCSGQIYSPGDKYFLADTTNEITLWAVWGYSGSGALDNNGCIVDVVIPVIPDPIDPSVEVVE